MALIDNIVSYWKLDESSGNASDSTATGNTLTNINTTSFAAAVINNGADMERSSVQYFTILDASQTGLDFSDALTFAMWVKFESALGREYYIAKRVAAGNQRSYLWYQNDANNMNLDWSSDGSAGAGVTVAWSPSTATFYHIAVTKSGTTVKFYVNGSQQGTDQTGGFSAIFNGSAPFEVGQWTDDAASLRSFDGFMDEIGVWSRALSGTEISQLYNSGSGLSYPFSTGPATLETWNTVAKANIESMDTANLGTIESWNTVA